MDFVFCFSDCKRIEFVDRTGVGKQWSLLLVLEKVEGGMMGFRKKTWGLPWWRSG